MSSTRPPSRLARPRHQSKSALWFTSSLRSARSRASASRRANSLRNVDSSGTPPPARPNEASLSAVVSAAHWPIAANERHPATVAVTASASTPGQRVAHPARVGHRLQRCQQSLVARRGRIGRQCRGRWHAGVTSGSGGWLGNPIQTRWSHPSQQPRRSHDDKPRGHRAAHQPFRHPGTRLQ